MAGEGRQSRNDRLTKPQSGAWASSSVDFVVLVRHLRKHSSEFAAANGGNCSPYALCAIPMLLSALRCLMIECEAQARPGQSSLEAFTRPNDLMAMLECYGVPASLLDEAKWLNEVRNEILHPAHLPSGTEDNWPAYLRGLKATGVLQSTGNPGADFDLIAQLSSHRLLAWSCRVARDLAEIVIRFHAERLPLVSNFLDTWNSIAVADER